MSRSVPVGRRIGIEVAHAVAIGAILCLAACADEPVTPPSGFPQQQSDHRDRTSANRNWPADPAPPDAPLRNQVIMPPALY